MRGRVYSPASWRVTLYAVAEPPGGVPRLSGLRELVLLEQGKTYDF